MKSMCPHARRSIAGAAILLLLFGTCAFAQPSRIQILVLDQPWRFHLGDDPRWKDPAFDDSSWGTLLPTKRWTAQGVKTDPSRYAWYRTEVPIESAGPLSLWLPSLHTAAEVFVNGNLVMRYGVPGDVYRAKVHIPPLAPLPALAVGSRAAIAVRIWLCLDDDESFLGAGLSAAPELGPADAMGAKRRLALDQQYRVFMMPLLAGLLGIVLGGLFLVCWRRQPDHAEYGWYAGLLFGRAVFDLVWFGLFGNGMFTRGAGLIEGAAYAVSLGSSHFFFRSYFRVPQRRAFPPLLTVCLAMVLADGCGWNDWITSRYTNLLLLAGHLPVIAGNALVLIREARRGNREAWTLAVPYGIQCAGLLIRLTTLITVFFGFQGYQAGMENGLVLAREPFDVPLEFAGLVLGSLAMTAILLNRFTRIAVEGNRLAQELDAARRVQEALVPSQSNRVRGLDVDCVYMAANEVGGDFYQILECEHGVLVVAGDVSGKGLKAAMIVSTAIGAIAATPERSPARLLGELNRALVDRVGGGFVTACAVLISDDGVVRAANAGHLPPYVGGREMLIEPGLPLGIHSGAIYEEATFALAPGEQLVLLSDGIAEAANADGELFGFERTRNISTRPAQEIADTARAWGQNDDITVVTMWRSA